MVRRASLEIVRRPTRFFSVWPSLRGAVAAALLVGLVLGATRWWALPRGAGALAFTPHVVGTATSAVGVRDVVGRDVNGDGKVDIITAGADGVKVYENTGNWKFALHVVDDKDAERVLVANVDGDSDLDLVVSLRGDSPSVRWYENRGDFEWQDTAIATAGADALVAVGDLDADGAPDLVVVSGRDTRTLERWMNNGRGVFAATTLATNTKITSLAAGDVTGNGYADIVAGGPNGLQRWTTSNGTSWTRVDIDDSNQNRTSLAIAHPGAGGAWIATGDTMDNELVLYRGGSSASSRATFGRKFLDTEVDAKAVAVADLDGDNDLDILAAAQDANTVFWYKNDGLDIFSRHTLATGLQSVAGVGAADLDGDGDLDIVTADHNRGSVYGYERIRQKPTATGPTDISQGSNGAGLVTFSTTLADDDGEPTRFRVQYSVDGVRWYKPWLTRAVTSAGAVDLENKQGYQVGRRNAVDTNQNDDVTVTLTWDTKSGENTGGPIIGDVNSVQLRVIPRDARDIGAAVVSGKFRVDNKAPTSFTLTLDAITATNASLSWTKPSDSSSFTYKLYYGTDHAAVLEQKSNRWEGSDEDSPADIDTTSAEITDLVTDKLYTFKLFATDAFGNVSAAPSVQGRSVTQATPEPTAQTPEPTPGEEVSPTPEPSADPSAEPSATPTPTATPPPVLQSNRAPLADAGPDQVVNPQALVILDGTASFDPDAGDSATLNYSWRQIDGPAVDLLSSSTVTPSFFAGEERQTYIFSLTVRDVQGASAIDTVTVATKALPQSVQVEVDVRPPETQPLDQREAVSPLVSLLLQPADLFLLVLSLLSTAILLIDRLGHVIGSRSAAATMHAVSGGGGERARSRVIHYKTGEAIAGALVLVYGEDGKLRAQERTNEQGYFASFFPPGVYRLAVRADGFAFATTADKSLAPDSILYSGGQVTVKDANKPPAIVIPMKPTAGEITTLRIRLLHSWQIVQRLGRLLSWPLFIAGALLNTVLVFVAPSLLYLVIEVVYVVLVMVKIAVEIRMRPAYGLVRDAITHIPLELAVVRLLEEGTNRLVMTRVTNNQGKFFALPPAGTYTITIAKSGYGTFTKEGVEITSEHDTTLQLTADLMPVAPQQGLGGLARARAATL